MPSFYDGYTQTVVVAFICFSGPGLFNALTGLGAAGTDDPLVANYANTLLYIAFVLSGFFGGALYNILGNRTLFFFGSLTFAFHALMLFLATLYPSVIPLAITSGLILGIGAACLWTAQGASVLSYSPIGQESLYISTFWSIFSFGGFFGGLVMFFGNIRERSNSATKANKFSYCIFVLLMLVGPLLSLIILQPTAKVIRADGEPVHPPKAKTVIQEISAVLEGFTDTNMHSMGLYFLMSNIGYAYFFNGLNSLFNIRTRGFNSALFWLIQMIGTKIALSNLDDFSISRRDLGQRFFYFLTLFSNIAFLIGAYIQFFWEGGWDKDNRPQTKIDILEIRRAFFPMLALLIFGLSDSLVQTYGMWMTSGLANGSTEKLARYSGFSKSIQSTGSAISWLIDLKGIKYCFQLFICWSSFLVSLPPVLVAVQKLPHFNTSTTEESDNLIL